MPEGTTTSCGFGTGAVRLLQKFAPGMVVGLNVSRLQLQAGNRLLRDSANVKVALLQGSATNMPLMARLCAVLMTRARARFICSAPSCMRKGW